MDQREGRIKRHGNENKEINIYRGANTGRAALAYQMLDRKRRTLYGLFSNERIKETTFDELANAEEFDRLVGSLTSNQAAIDAATARRQASAMEGDRDLARRKFASARTIVEQWAPRKRKYEDRIKNFDEFARLHAAWKEDSKKPYGVLHDWQNNTEVEFKDRAAFLEGLTKSEHWKSGFKLYGDRTTGLLRGVPTVFWVYAAASYGDTMIRSYVGKKEGRPGWDSSFDSPNALAGRDMVETAELQSRDPKSWDDLLTGAVQDTATGLQRQAGLSERQAQRGGRTSG